MSATIEETALIDSIALNDAARAAGITFRQARQLVKAFDDLPVVQVRRIVGLSGRRLGKRRTGR